jgi:hypothetical protein
VKPLLIIGHFLLMRSKRKNLILGFAAVVGILGLSQIGDRTADAESLAQSRPPMFVLQVGIGKYLNSPKWADLRGSITDVVEMRKLLVGDRFLVPQTNIETLTDEKATKQGIFSAFQKNLIANAKDHFEKTKRRDAVVLFQYSGHGSQTPDADGDETDKLDETLVTYDSQDIQGKNFDITDDEIFLLTSELKRYTDNIVYIFDSCHSGSGTRNAEDARRLPARTTVPEPVTMPGLTTRSGSVSHDGAEGTVMPPGSDYIVISAAHAEQLATQKYCFEECGSEKEPVVFGLLTYHLIDELKNAGSETSYRELMENVIRKVEAERPTQTPLIEGDERRSVFGSLGSSRDAYVAVIAADEKSVRIRAGAIQGVSMGSIVSFFDRSVSKFDVAEKTAIGRVTAVTATESVVTIESSKRNVTTTDKGVVASADFGASRAKVVIDEGAGAGIAKELGEAFDPNQNRSTLPAIEVLPYTPTNRQVGRWNFIVLKDKYSTVFPDFRQRDNSPNCGEANGSISPDTDIYYITGQDYVPLFGFCVNGSIETRSAAGALARALTHMAKYRSVQQIQNRRTRLSGKITVKPIRLSTTSGAFSGNANCVDGKFTVDKYESLVRIAPSRFSIGNGEVFWFEVTNNSPFDIYISMLNLRSDGSIKLQVPRNIDEEKNGVLIAKNGGKRIVNSDRCRINALGDFTETGAFRTARYPEQDSFKFLFTTSALKWEDLSYLEMDAVRRNGNASLVTINEWIAIDLTFEVGDSKKL